MNRNIIDLRPYLALPAEEPQAPAVPGVLEKVLNILSRCIDSAASITIALCICVCTLVFFTML